MDPDDHSVQYYIKTVKLDAYFFQIEANFDDLIYLGCLLLSIPIGFLFKYASFKVATKAYLSTLIGFIMALLVCSTDIYHSFILILVNAIFMTTLSPR